MPTFGERFKELRLNKKMKQEELINDFNKKFHYSFTKSAVSQYENDKRIPEIQALNDFADYFNVSVDYLLGKSDDRKIILNDDIHLKYALKLADILKSNGYELTEESIPDIVDYAKYKLEQLKKKQDN